MYYNISIHINQLSFSVTPEQSGFFIALSQFLKNHVKIIIYNRKEIFMKLNPSNSAGGGQKKF